MRTFIFVRGLERDTCLASVEELVRATRKKQGIVITSPTGDVHIDDLKEGSVTVVHLQDEDSYVHVIDEAVTRFTVLAVGLEARKNAERAVERMLKKGTVGLIQGLTITTFPAGTPIKECHSVVIEYPSKDAEVRSITFDAEAYYGGLSNKKLSGKKLR